MREAVVLDIEGTTSSEAHVRGVLFPYARTRLASWVRAHRDDPEVRAVLAEVRPDGGTPEEAVRLLQHWSDEDRKAPPLKRLQGMIWAEGYARGDLTGHVYPDTVTALAAWHRQRTPVHIYSSGSVQAQRLWFRHTPFGDLRDRLSGYFDTTTAGPKKDPASYRVITGALGVPAHGITFASDSVGELDAARAAGWRTVLVRRTAEERAGVPGEDPAGHGHPVVRDLLAVAQGVPA
ncbi:acireductone synthase [Streptomyces sp. NPDC052020]|uniref:acireductone synthase n=1 Tax=Streptomyces sp. NPDC052020 TaxID=3155677 RepID=UPI0034313F4B